MQQLGMATEGKNDVKYQESSTKMSQNIFSPSLSFKTLPYNPKVSDVAIWLVLSHCRRRASNALTIEKWFGFTAGGWFFRMYPPFVTKIKGWSYAQRITKFCFTSRLNKSSK